MVSGTRVCQALISLILWSLPRSAIAVRADLDPSNPSLSAVLRATPDHTLPNTGSKGRCMAVQWPSGDTVTSFDNQDNNLVIVIESTIGFVLCYIPQVDLAKMGTTGAHDIKRKIYWEVYQEKMLGTNGDLTIQMRQLIAWQIKGSETTCLPQFRVLGIQIATAKGKNSMLERIQLVRETVKDLKLYLTTYLATARDKLNLPEGNEHIPDQSDWRVTIYPVLQGKAGIIAIAKSSMKYTEYTEEGTPVPNLLHVVNLWISGATEQSDSQDISPVVHLSLYPSTYYSIPVEQHSGPDDFDAMECDVDENQHNSWVAFEDAQIAYPVEGLYLALDVPKTVTELFNEKDQPAASALNPLWMNPNYDSGANAYCRSVLYSRGGSLIGLVNTMQGPVLMTQASNGAMICSIHRTAWDAMNIERKQRQDKGRPYDHALRAFTEPFEVELKKLKEASRGGDETFRVFGTQLWLRGRTGHLMNDMIRHGEQILRKVVSAGAGSDLTISPWPSGRAVDVELKPDSEWPYSVVWQAPLQAGETETKVWIWKTGLGMGLSTKPPLAVLDLSLPYEVKGVEFSTAVPCYFMPRTRRVLSSA